jgi:hypothetical protein
MNQSRIKIITAFAAMMGLSGCTTAKIINGPDGTPHQLITCGNIEDCYQKAGEVCGGKYKIVNTSNTVSGANGMTSSSTHLLVKCE